MTGYKSVIKSRWLIASACLILGAAVVLGFRFFTYKKPDSVHYHANFALYINGQREEFKGDKYYTEVEMCTTDDEDIPGERAHMHDNINNVVHVEDHAVTWGQFLSNLGWALGNDMLQAPDGTVYNASGDNKLHIMLNGQDYTGLGSFANTVIKDQDRLLLSFGDQNDTTIKQEFAAVPSTAAHYDNTPDPKTCSGSQGPTMHDRLTHML